MRSLLRPLVFVLALALAANSAAIRQCAAAAQSAGQPSVSHGAHQLQASHAGAHGQHQRHAGHDHAAASSDTVTLPDDADAVADHAPAKCCSMCTFASMLPQRMDARTPIGVIATLSPRLTQPGYGAGIRVDPGIPKRIA